MAITAYAPPVALFLTAENAPYHRVIHCMLCGLHLCDITGRVTTAVDNSGLAVEQLAAGELGYIEIKCQRSTCHQRYRLFTPPPVVTDFIPIVTLNGFPI